jgi:hypothetical protein
MAKLVGERDGGVVFEGTLGRQYDLAYGVELVPREGSNGRTGGAIGGTARDDDGTICLKWATKPQSRIAFESLEKDYDLSRFIVSGEARPPALDERGPRAVPREGSAASGVELASLVFDGDTLEVIELDGEGWVSFPSLLRPFGKRADSYLGLLDGWARTRQERVPSRTGAFDGRGGGLQLTTLLHFEDAPMAIARLDRRGMEDDAKAKHTRYLKECAKALADYFLRGRAENPRARADTDLPPWVRGLFEAVGGAALVAQQAANAAAGAAGVADRKAEEAKAEAGAARATAEEARAVAEEARETARAAAEPPPPGHRVRRDGAEVYGGPVPGSMAAVQCAAAQGMPERSTARTHWVLLAIATGAVNDAEATVLDQKHRADGRRFMPKALEYTKPASEAYLRRLRALGYDVVNGLVVQARPTSVSLRAATADALHTATTRAAADPQQSIPGVGNDTQPKAS